MQKRNCDSAGKITIVYLLRILEKYSDEKHHLRAMQIVHYMEEDYGWTIKWTNARENLRRLMASGVADIHIEDGEYWIGERTFCDEELHYLTDVVRTGRYIPKAESKELIDRLKSFGTTSFREGFRPEEKMDGWHKEDSSEMLGNVGVIKRAIAEKKKIRFCYKDYDASGRLRKRGAGVTATPYRMILKNGRYYLLCSVDPEDFMRTYRLDLIADAEVGAEDAKPLLTVKGYEKGTIDYRKFAASPYMYSEEPKMIRLHVQKEALKEVMDWFGEIKSITAKGDGFDVLVTAMPTPTMWWALQYLEVVEILQPVDLRTRITEIVHTAAEGKYRKM